MIFASPLVELPEHVIIKKSPRARRIALRLDPKDQRFHLILPKGISMRRAQRFAEEHEGWMQEKLRDLPTRIEFRHGTALPILGKRVTIHISKKKFRPAICIEGRKLLVSENDADTAGRIERFLRKFVQAELEILSREKAARIRKKVKSVTVRDPKTRWGSCSSSGALSYSWRIVFAPYVALDYLVAHEVAHLRHMDHSDKFWALCEDLADNYEAGHAWMRENGQELRRYG